MSDGTKAVFLSYASQDAEAAKRIADALRGAGVEVWFDQNELVGGDAWDQKIRGQIASCALFVPLISANTQARLEGYFRREWKQAAARTHDMADEKAFLLPVVIDDTRDASAKVPPEFKAVQWTRLAGGEAPAAFVQRVKKLLAGEEQSSPDVAPGRAPAPEPAPMPSRRPTPLYRAPGFLVGLALCGLLLAYKIWRPTEAPPAVAVPVAREVAGSELARVRARIIPDRWQREDFAVVSAMLDRLIQANPDDAEAWALRSIINSLQVVRNFDAGTKSLEAGKSDADRALRLAPGSPLGEIAFGLHLVAMTSRGGDAAACRPYIDRAVAALPPSGLTRYAKLVSHWFGYEFASVRRVALDWLEVEPQASFPAWILSQSYLVQRQPAEAEKWAERALVDTGITGVRAYYTLFEAKYYLRADLRAAREALERMPATGRAVHRVVHARWLLAMAGQKWDEALQELSRVPEPFLFDRSYHGPKALLAGFAHQRAGRPEAAAAQFREAERLLRERLAADPDNEELHGVLAITLACANRGADARSELAMVEPLVRGRAPTLQRGSLALTMAQTYAVLRDPAGLATWLRLLFAEPSQFPLTPASIRLDPRFAGALESPEVQALLQEFAGLDRSADSGAKASEKSIAVLPFTNMSEDKDANAFFADGIHEDILTNLAGIRELRVVSRTSVMDYRGTTKKIPQIGQELNVAYVLEGSVRRAGNKVRVTGQLIRTATDEHVWAKSFDRDLTDIFQIQAELAKAIAGELNAAISPQEQTQLTARPTENLAAYDLFLKSREIANRGAASNREDLQKRERLLQSAVELDPKFLDAWCELVQAHVGLIAGSVDTTPARLAKAATALDRAKALAPDAPEVARAVGAYQLFGLREPARAVEQFARLVELHPNDTESLNWLGTAQMLAGRWAESLATQRRLTQLDPANRAFSMSLALTLRVGRRYDEAIAELRRMLASRPEDTGLLRALGYVSFLATGSTEVAEQALKRLEAIDPNGSDAINLRQTRALRNRDYAEYFRLDQANPGGLNRGSFDSSVFATLEAGGIHRALGDAESARKRLGNLPATLRAQLELEPNNTQYLRSIAMAESILGNHAEAIRWIDRAAEVMPETKESRIGLTISVLRARILAWAGEKDRAIAEVARLLQLPSDLNVHQMKGSIGWAPLLDDLRFQALMADPKNNQPLF